MPTGARTAKVVRKPKTDKLSDPSITPPTEKTLSGLIILPRVSKEEGQGWVTNEGWDIYVLPTSRVTPLPGGTPRAWMDGDVVASDLLEIDGKTWQVEGPPAPYDKGQLRKATLIRVGRVGTS